MFFIDMKSVDDTEEKCMSPYGLPQVYPSRLSFPKLKSSQESDQDNFFVLNKRQDGFPHKEMATFKEETINFTRVEFT